MDKDMVHAFGIQGQEDEELSVAKYIYRWEASNNRLLWSNDKFLLQSMYKGYMVNVFGIQQQEVEGFLKAKYSGRHQIRGF
ncbi:hypothetical protein JTE90_020173 [Oedothorax gibbosus]|uniref:Uncharacterized protein n=1 Tax=Oedothorax gibbosus TaxID=931172 RepID=A0AAV6TXH8_9ARAC|nr:hypothetical protein JTE90_020173 [Oedothorax gibbosus]